MFELNNHVDQLLTCHIKSLSTIHWIIGQKHSKFKNIQQILYLPIKPISIIQNNPNQYKSRKLPEFEITGNANTAQFPAILTKIST